MDFADYKPNREKWITFVESGFYPDVLVAAINKYRPILQLFGRLLGEARDSKDLFMKIASEPTPIRTQLQRIFRKYVSPDTSVEMLKVKENAKRIVRHFGDRFRPLEEVRLAFEGRPEADEALIAVLVEYETRGQKGYELTEAFFDWFRAKLGGQFVIEGPTGAGPDVPLRRLFPDYPTSTTVDFAIRSKGGAPLVLGYARYDSDRGGAQGLDRIRSYSDNLAEILGYAETKGLKLKILLVNDGPGLLLGLLWDRYADLERRWGRRVIVATLKMLNERVTPGWIAE